MTQVNQDIKLNTEEFAKLLHIKPSSVRTNLCLNGHVYGIKPIKLPNRRLLWSANAVNALLNGEASA